MMLQRRDFLKTVGATAASLILHPSLPAEIAGGADPLRFASNYMDLQLSGSAPEFLNLNIDGLGKGRRGDNTVAPHAIGTGFQASASTFGGSHRVEYRVAGAERNSVPAWTLEFSGARMTLTSRWSAKRKPVPFVFRFNLHSVNSTVLGVFRNARLLRVPALIHCPCQGSMRLTASDANISLKYESTYHQPIATLSLPGASATRRHVAYTLDVTAIYPDVPGIAGDPRFDAFRCNWLNALQLNPSYPALANNTASDTCAFCYYEFADIAALTPQFAEGLSALDVVRQTLDRILAGGSAYGLPERPWTSQHSPCSDTFPSLLIAAANCVRGNAHPEWLAANYGGIRGWAEAMLATDTNHNGLIKYSISGNSGIWPDGDPQFRPSNWWDTIGFGYEDAYGNALAYRALGNMAMMADMLAKRDDAARYRAAAGKLRAVYYKHFYNPATGVLGGWRSSDGQLHDYYFLWVNGIAIHYGLVSKPQANAIMDKLMAKMQEAGYDNFRLGLPGNLVSVALKDCVHKLEDGRFGCGVRPDNSDGFQKYENGGATGAFAFFTLAALYDLGRNQEADKILFPMLDEYESGGFSRFGADNRSTDWRQWNGAPWGYEGYLTDDYYALLAVLLRHSQIPWEDGYRSETTLT